MEWISVDARLPNSDTDILVLLVGGFIRTSYYFSDSFGDWFSDSDFPWNKAYGPSPQKRKAHKGLEQYVTHWMPLPDPTSYAVG